MAQPIFVFDRDGDLHVEVEGRPTWMEAIDVSAGEYPDAYALSGERIRVEVEEHPDSGTIVYVPTGDAAQDELKARLREYVYRVGLDIEDTGDFVIDVANSLVSADWQVRWPNPGFSVSRRG